MSLFGRRAPQNRLRDKCDRFTERPSGGQAPRRFPNERGALKARDLVATQPRQSPRPHGETSGWKAILNTLTVHHGDRIAANTIKLNFMTATTT